MIVNEGKILFQVVKLGIEKAGFSLHQEDEKAVLVWYDTLKEIDYFSNLHPWQIVNRLPAANYICRKAPLIRLIHRMQTIAPKFYDFIPESYILPIDQKRFIDEIREHKYKYISKPDNGALGLGIKIYDQTTDPETIPTPNRLIIAQKYISSYLIDKTKFDLRVYVLVTSIKPLSIYVYRDGIARFCSEKADTNNIYAQLTNTAINRKNPEMKSKSLSTITKTIKQVFKILHKEGKNVNAIWKKIDKIAILTLLANIKFMEEGMNKKCPPNESVPSRCYQLLGFDILLDTNLKPYLLEVNYRPSLEYDTAEEKELKINMISDIIRIVGNDKEFQEYISSQEALSDDTFNSSGDCKQFKPQPIDQDQTLFDHVYPIKKGSKTEKAYKQIHDKAFKMTTEISKNSRLPIKVPTPNSTPKPIPSLSMSFESGQSSSQSSPVKEPVNSIKNNNDQTSCENEGKPMNETQQLEIKAEQTKNTTNRSVNQSRSKNSISNDQNKMEKPRFTTSNKFVTEEMVQSIKQKIQIKDEHQFEEPKEETCQEKKVIIGTKNSQKPKKSENIKNVVRDSIRSQQRPQSARRRKIVVDETDNENNYVEIDLNNPKKQNQKSPRKIPDKGVSEKKGRSGSIQLGKQASNISKSNTSYRKPKMPLVTISTQANTINSPVKTNYSQKLKNNASSNKESNKQMKQPYAIYQERGQFSSISISPKDNQPINRVNSEYLQTVANINNLVKYNDSHVCVWNQNRSKSVKNPNKISVKQSY